MPETQNDKAVRKVLEEATIKLRWITGHQDIRVTVYYGTGDRSPQAMLSVIAATLNMSPDDVYVKSRSAQYVELRRICAICIYRLYEHMSHPRIGELMGVDHSTVHHMIEAGEGYLAHPQAHEQFVQKFENAYKTAETWLKGESL